MKVDPATLLFSDIDPETRADMLRVCTEIVLQGKVPYPRPAWLEQWLDEGNFGEREKTTMYLLTVSATLPMRVFLSLLLEPDTTAADAVRDKWQKDFAELYTKHCALKNAACDYRNYVEKRSPTLGLNEDSPETFRLDEILDG